jgi:hypothetical protein
MSEETFTMRLERLCEHHDCSEFDCGDPFFNETLLQCQEGFRAGRDLLVFVLATQDHRVEGYVYMQDIDYTWAFPGDETNASKTLLRYCMIPALAVSRKTQGGQAFFTLAEKAVEMAFLRKERLEDTATFERAHHGKTISPSTYRGFLCVAYTHRGLYRQLARRWEFKPFSLDEFYLWHPFPEDGKLPPTRGS